MASIDDLMATVCADCPNVWAYSCACYGWCSKTGMALPDPPERDAPHTHCPRCGLNQDPCLCTMHPKGEPMTGYDSTADTMAHIEQVGNLLLKICDKLNHRRQIHDLSKLLPPEKEAYDEYTPLLAGLTYGSEEYRAILRQMKPAIQHHYECNSHHPEHHAEGIAGMNLLDLVEMFCDWKAASLRHKDGDFRTSLDINRERFGISDQLFAILVNSVGLVE